MFNQINEIRALATKYSKNELANMARMGLIEPQKAVMAGMMIDRIAKSAMQPPTTTVAEDVLAPPPQAGIMGAPQAPAPSAGVAGLPSGIQNMAGGGIVAFADGDLVQGTTPGMSLEDLKAGKMPIYSAPAPEQVDLAKAAQRREQAEQQAGLDPRFFEKLRTEVTGDKEDFAKQREEAKGAAALSFGLGLFGARKGQEFQTASEAGKQALAQYGSTIKDIRSQEKEMKKTLRDLSLAEQSYKKSNSDKDLAAVQRYEDQLQAHKENIAAMTNRAVQTGATAAQQIYNVDQQKATQLAVAGIQRKTSLDVAEINRKTQLDVHNLPSAEQKMINALLDDLHKTKPEATLADAMAIYRGLGKPQNTLSYEEALKITYNDPTIPKDKKIEEAMKLMNQDPMRSGVTGMAGPKVPNPFQLSPEAQKALQQYGGK